MSDRVSGSYDEGRMVANMGKWWGMSGGDGG